jgi:uncharacterized protein YndB with AHSA1/START domain
MTTATISTDKDAIISEIQIAAPPERVFRALTDPKELLQWFTEESCKHKLWEMDAKVGGRWRFQTEKSKHVVNGVDEFEGHGEVLEIDPPRLLVYTWIANWHADPKRKTVVRWELKPSRGGTLVKVTHSGLADEDAARKDYSGGWPGVVELLKKFIEQ